MDCQTRDNAILKHHRKRSGATISLLGLCVASLSQAALAAEEQSAGGGFEPPDLEFLEFLGSFETDSGEWIEPSSMLDEYFNELLDVAAAMETSSGDNASTNNGNDNPDGNSNE